MPLWVAKQCPDCHEMNIAPSKPRNLNESMLSLFPLARMYRCHNCNWRGRLIKLRVNHLGSVSNIVFFLLGLVFVISIATLIYQVFFTS